MAGDLLIRNLSEADLDTLVERGGVPGGTIFHADKYTAEAWNELDARLAAAVNGSQVQNRAGLPPHFYITFSRSTFKGPDAAFEGIIGAALRPLTIVSAHPGLDGWLQAPTNQARGAIFTEALDKADITLEVYGYNGQELRDRNTGEVPQDLRNWMKLQNQ